jgi:hypothetical protein
MIFLVDMNMKILISLTLVVSIGTIPLQMFLEQTNVEAASRHTGGVNFTEAPVFVSDDNVYVAWWSNKTGNDEVLFRASNDGGLTFGDKINLSNTTDIESVDAEIAADGENVYVTWWERNENVHPHTNEPVLRISNDAGQTFGPLLQLSQNGTLGSTDDSEEGQ